MDFRWVSVIAIWTLLSGPVFHASKGQPRASHQGTAKTTVVRAVGR
jgi:hypothetical protein